MRRFSMVLVFFLCIVKVLLAQNIWIEGCVVDEEKHPVEYATVLLQTLDRKHSDVVFTDSVGHFRIGTIGNEYQLILQHILYEADTLSLSTDQLQPLLIVLKQKDINLKDIEVVAERPLVRMEGNALSYDAKLIASKRTVLNAYEIVKEIPGVMAVEEMLSLAGTDKLNIVINGQISIMTMSQIVSMLKSIPASSIQKVDVMYNAPAKYNVKGALINVVLDKAALEVPFTGEVMVNYKQSVFATSIGRLSLSYNKDNLRIDLFANISSGKNWQEETSYSRHSLKDRMVEVDENTSGRGNHLSGDLRLGLDYTFNDKSNLVFAYYTDQNKNIVRRVGSTNYMDTLNYNIESFNRRRDRDQLHNSYIQYTNRKLQLGGEYTFYGNPSTQNYTDSIVSNNSLLSGYINNSNQRIARWSAFVNHGVNFGSAFELNYGLNGGYNHSNSSINYKVRDEYETYIDRDSLRLVSKQKEYTGTGFVDGVYKFNDKLSANFSLKLEYFRADYIKNKIKTTLWDDWTLFPNLSFTYNQSEKNMFQLSFSSDKNYPSYWAINPEIANMSSYSQIEGNPELKPSKVFRGQLMYMRDRKYTLMAFMQYIPDYFVQLPHLSEDELKLVYKYENYDYLLRSGIMFTANFKFGEIYNNRLLLQAMRSDEKIKDFYGSSFDYTSYSAVVMLNNTLNITKNLAFQFDIFYQTNARQGVYRLGPMWSLDSSLKWNINGKMYIVAKYNNIVRNNIPRPLKLDYGNQYQLMKQKEKSSFNISFVWSFGGYKAKKYKEVDDSRLGK